MNIEVRDNKLHISGYVNAVERDSKPIMTRRGRCVEQIAAGAFAASLSDGHEVRMKLNHGRAIGSTADGTISLREDTIGLYAEAQTDDEELITLAGKGELRGWSFGFHALDDEIEKRDGREDRRRVKALDLQEVSILSVTPAYDGTSLECRSYDSYDEDDPDKTDDTDAPEDDGAEPEERADDGAKQRAAMADMISRIKMQGYILEKKIEQRQMEERYNHYHNPVNGQFASGKGGGEGLYYSMGKGKGEVVGASSPYNPIK